MPVILLQRQAVTYLVERSTRRKRLAVQVTPDRQVIVRAPAGTSDGTIEDFLRANARWVLTSLNPEQARADRTRTVHDHRGPLQFLLTRRRGRRRLSVLVHPDGQVEVRAPMNARLSEVDAFVLRKADWIRGHVAQAHSAGIATRRFASGETILYQGRQHTLAVEPSPLGPHVVQEGDVLRVFVSPTADPETRRFQVRDALRSWMTDRALQVARARVPLFAQKLNVQYRRVTIKDMKTRWGSCSPRGHLSIGFRIVMAPAEVVDYLIVHELCHLVHPNHSRDFWALVASIVPQHRDHERWLRQHGRLMQL